MDELRQWAISLIIAAVAGTVITVISPRGSADKIMRTVTGIFVVASMAVPLMQTDFYDVSAQNFFEYSDSDDDYLYELEQQLVDACKTALENQIIRAASQTGADVESVESELSVDEDGCIIIHKIVVKITENSAKYELEKLLKQETGIQVTVR